MKRTSTARTASQSARPVAEPSSPQLQPGAQDTNLHAGDVRKMRERIERQYRANRTLSQLVRKLVGEKADVPPIELAPRLPTATLSQHPKRRPAPAPDAWWPAAPVPPREPLTAPVGHECFSLADSIHEVVGVSVMGLRGVDLDRVVGAVAEEQLKTKNFRPVFLTDAPDVPPFVSRGYAFEYFSRFRDYLASSDDSRNQEPRREVLAAKWGFERILQRDDARGANREYPPLAAILKHNADMSRACHQDRFEWIIETLRIALSAERYDVAEGLAEYLLVFFDTLSKANQIPAARMLCRKFIAFGEADRLRKFLFKNIAQVRKDDALFTWFSIHCTAATDFSSDLALLPSGKLNSYYISKRMAAAGEQAMPNLLSAGDGATSSGNLLLANYFAIKQDAALYKMFVNRVIARNDGPSLAKIQLGHGNVLAHLSFDEPPPARQQPELVSVIMSSHNAAETTAYAAASILNQSHHNIELLICDDGSTDATPKILETLRHDPRVRLFRSKAQQGTYNIRNNLLAQTRGSYVTFHDSDDFAFPNRIERQLTFLKEQNAAAVVGQWYRVTKDGEFVFSTDHNVARLAVVSLFAPKGVFERFGPYRSARFGADTEFYERLRMKLGQGAVELMPTPLMFGLSSATSLTRSPGIEASEDGFRAPARRSYAAAAARRRQIGGAVGGLPDLDDVLRKHGTLMDDAGVEPVEGDRQ
jgi:hypothetical protein